ncbi:MAG: hypothetical protein E6L01_00400 [Thaumarchaeota archaeon]|nr:MAG: hypothetical protein E6L01_00400 [Nitrososphaerota archaeon]
MGTVSLHPENLNDFIGSGRYSCPEFIWYNPVCVTSLTFLDSNKLGKQYQNDLFVGDFHTGNLYHFDLDEKEQNFLLIVPLRIRLLTIIVNLTK